MDYKKIERDEYDIHIIKNKDFHTIDFRIFFTENITKEMLTYHNVLVDVLTYASKEYDTKEKLIKKCQDLYSLRPVASVLRNGNLLVTKFSISTVNSKYLHENHLKDNILLLKEIILNPLVKNNQFVSKYFSIVKKELELETKTIEEEPRLYTNISLLKLLDNNEGKLLSGYADLNILSQITKNSLYQSYQKMLRNSKIDIFISGNIRNEQEIVDIITNNFKFSNKKVILKHGIIEHTTKKDTPVLIKETKNYQQSKLSIGFKLYGLTDYENRYVSFVFNNILGGGANSLLLKCIREENSLCYYISSYINRLDNILIINSGINKDNYDSVLSLIKEILLNIEKGKFSVQNINMAKKELLYELSNILESNHSISDYYYGQSIFNSDELNMRMHLIKKVSKKDIINFSKKINLDTIFFLEGDL